MTPRKSTKGNQPACRRKTTRERQFPRTDLYCITAGELLRGRSNEHIVKQMLEAGVTVVQYREKEMATVHKYRECLAIRELCRSYGACFIVNDDVGLALAAGADGIHVGQDDLPVQAVRKIVGDGMLIGLSVCSREEADRAMAEGVADYLGVGPIYATKTKKDAAAPVGLECLEYVAHNCQMPVVAIGGITRANVAEVIRHGAACVAIISDIVCADDIKARIKEIRKAIAEAGG